MKPPPLSPLSLIAVFAGVIEASALASLPFLNESSQGIYTWFLVGFPFFLTVLFFLTLNFNADSLAASDKPDAPPTPGAPAPEPPLPARAPVVMLLSGRSSRLLMQRNILRALAHRPGTACHWVFHDLENRTCIRFSIDTEAAPPGSGR